MPSITFCSQSSMWYIYQLNDRGFSLTVQLIAQENNWLSIYHSTHNEEEEEEEKEKEEW